MKTVSSFVVSLGILALASSAHAQTATEFTAVKASPSAQFVQDGARFRLGVELGGGLGMIVVFSPSTVAANRSTGFNIRLGAQINNQWAVMAQSGVSLTGGLVSTTNSLLAEFSPTRGFGFGFGPTAMMLFAPNGMITAPAATLRFMGYLGSSAPARRHSFVFGLESNTGLMADGLFTSAQVTLGYEMH